MKYTLVKKHLYDLDCNGQIGSNNLEELIREGERYIIPVEIFENGEDGTIWSGRKVWDNGIK